MAKLTITSVIDEGELDDSGIRQWSNDYGTFYEVTAFAGKELVSASKKSLADALELQGILKASIGQPLEMVVEHKGTSKNGNAKWKLKEILSTSPGGDWSRDDRSHPARVTRPPESNQEASIRAAVALKAAVEWYCAVKDPNQYPEPLYVTEAADYFDAWLAKKSGAVEQGSVPSSELAPSTATAPAPDPSSDEGGTEELGEGSSAPSSDTYDGDGSIDLRDAEHVHEPDTSVEAKAGRYPCACGLWVKP